MNPLRLSPLPSVRTHEESGSLLMEKEGFVDEEAVRVLMSGPTHLRSTSYPEDLALAADDLDFAGWQLPSAIPPRSPEFPPQVIDAIVRRRATPPVMGEPGIGAPHRGAHRWWLAGLAGVLSTLLFSILLLTLSSRPELTPETVFSPELVTISRRAPLPRADAEPKASSELTDASSHRP